MIILMQGFKIKIYLFILFILSIILVGQVNSEVNIIAKEGDTLYKISNEYGVSLKELMHKNNLNDANKLVEGSIIFIPENNINTKEKGVFKYNVKEGDTLYKIARFHNVKVKDIINLNMLNDESYLKLGQIILLPAESYNQKEERSLAIAKQKVNYHQISNKEEVSEISEIHNIPIEDIISMNKINRSQNLAVGTILKIREDKRNSNKVWLDYGPIRIKWSDWRYVEGNYITNAENKNKTSFFLAVNCEKRRINHRLKDGKWNNWFFAKDGFEHDFINDFCDQDISF